MTFEQLYEKVLRKSLDGLSKQEIEQLLNDKADKKQLDCLLNPQKSSLVWQTEPCTCNNSDSNKECCVNLCPFDAISKDENGIIKINDEKCLGCNECVKNCSGKKIVSSKDVVSCFNAIKSKSGVAYALIAPAFYGQFDPQVTPGKLRSAFKTIGFDGMIEVALFADILTLKEALEFDKNINTESDFQLTSCCCPMWIAMIRKVYKQLVPHLPASVSPMIACGRAIKILHPDCITVFIGPCIAKKAEAREKDLKGAIDFVLTFQEINDVFSALNLDLSSLPDDKKDHSSSCGRIYARTGGVSEAVKRTLEKISPDRKISVKTKSAQGVPECKKLLSQILNNEICANFFEGMGCVGGCVGGPKVMVDKKIGEQNINNYGRAAKFETPIENPYVIELLNRLGFNSITDLLEKSDIFTRDL